MVNQDMNASQVVAWNVRRIRVSRGIASEALAAASGVDRSYVSRLERGLANPTIGILEQIAAALEVGMGELFVVPDQGEDRPMRLPGGRRRR
jgi:transcriptional regulator with XRE-family HTH domain